MISDAVDLVRDAIASCFDQVKLYHSDPPADCCDFVAISIDAIRSTSDFPNPSGADVFTHPMVDIRVTTLRPCWPTSDYGFPDPDDTDEAAALLIADAQRLWDAVSSIKCDAGCVGLVIGEMTPVPPQEGCAGWTIILTIETF